MNFSANGNLCQPYGCTKTVNSIAAELEMQFYSYLSSDSNAFQFLIRRVLFVSLATPASKTKFITREIQIESGSRETAINFMSFLPYHLRFFRCALPRKQWGEKKKSENDNLIIYESVFFRGIRRIKCTMPFFICTPRGEGPREIMRESFKLHRNFISMRSFCTWTSVCCQKIFFSRYFVCT